MGTPGLCSQPADRDMWPQGRFPHSPRGKSPEAPGRQLAKIRRLQTSCFPAPGVLRGKTEELGKTLKSSLQEAGGVGEGQPYNSLSVESV